MTEKDDYIEEVTAECKAAVRDALTELQQVINTAPPPVRTAVERFLIACGKSIKTYEDLIVVLTKALREAQSQADKFKESNDRLLKINQEIINENFKQLPPGGSA